MKKFLSLLALIMIFCSFEFGVSAEIKYPKAEMTVTNLFGGTRNDYFNSISATSDGGYIAAGSTSSGDQNIKRTENPDMSMRAVVAKYDVNRNLKAYSVSTAAGSEYTVVFQYTDSTYVAVGRYSDGKVFITMYDSELKELWVKSFGDSSFKCNSATKNKKGQIVLCGVITKSVVDEAGVSKLNSDAYIYALNSNGDKLWDYTFGGVEFDEFNSITSTSDDYFVAAGNTVKPDGVQADFDKGEKDAVILKIDDQGKPIWIKSFGGSLIDNAKIVKAAGNNFYGVFETNSYDKDLYGINTAKNFLSTVIAKFDSNGDLTWGKTFGPESDSANVTGMTLLEDSSPVLTGYTSTFDGVFSNIYINGVAVYNANFMNYAAIFTPSGSLLYVKGLYILSGNQRSISSISTLRNGNIVFCGKVDARSVYSRQIDGIEVYARDTAAIYNLPISRDLSYLEITSSTSSDTSQNPTSDKPPAKDLRVLEIVLASVGFIALSASVAAFVINIKSFRV